MKSVALLAAVAAAAVWAYWNLALIVDVLQWVLVLAIGGLMLIGVSVIAGAILSSPMALLAFLLGGFFFGDDC